MRRNLFGEAYCHTAAELTGILEGRGLDPDEVYGVKHPADDLESESEPDIEILMSGDGETVCYIEAKTMEECIGIASEAGVKELQ